MKNEKSPILIDFEIYRVKSYYKSEDYKVTKKITSGYLSQFSILLFLIFKIQVKTYFLLVIVIDKSKTCFNLTIPL